MINIDTPNILPHNLSSQVSTINFKIHSSLSEFSMFVEKNKKELQEAGLLNTITESLEKFDDAMHKFDEIF